MFGMIYRLNVQQSESRGLLTRWSVKSQDLHLYVGQVRSVSRTQQRYEKFP